MDLLASKPLVLLLCVVGCCAQSAVLPPGPIDAILGGNVTLKTIGGKLDFNFLIWNFNDGSKSINIVTASASGVKVGTAFTGRASLNATNGYLTIGPLKSEDSGDYAITINPSAGDTVTGEVQLRVLKPVSDVSIKSSLSEAIEHNSTVVLTCSAKGSFLQFSWLRGDVPIVDDGKRFTVKNGELSSNLTIKDVLRTDQVGPIYCTASNQLQLARSAPFNLTVYYGPDAVAISPLAPPYISSKANFSLSCSAVSSPSADFLWYRDQQEIGSGGPILTLGVINSLGFGNKMGNYTCKAQNKKTQRTVSSAAVAIAVIEPIPSAEVSGPAAILIAGNSTANISCRATAGSAASTTWLKDKQPLAASGRLLFSANISWLRIDPLQKEDNGEYTCRLENAVSSAEASYKMVVNYGPEQATVTGQKAVEVNGKVTLDCSAPSVPPAIFSWKFNNTLTDVKTARYLIDMALYKNTGTYTCEAYNAVTGKSTAQSHFLSVKEEGALDKGLSDGAIAGIVIAVLVALGAAIGLIMYCRQKVPVESPY